MDRPTTILAAVDLSPCSQASLAHAFRLAQSRGCEVVVLHAVQPYLHNRAWLDAEAARKVPTIDRIIADSKQAIAPMIDALKPACRVRLEVVEGHTLGTILQWCDQLQPELLTIGAHSTSDAYRHMGYIASGAIRKASAPVLAAHTPSFGAFKNILVATDFSDTAARALTQALRIAAVDASRIEIMHAFADPTAGPVAMGPAGLVPSTSDLAERVEKSIKSWAAPFLADASGIDVSYAGVCHTKPGQAIVEHAHTRGVDLIVLGTKGTSNLHDLLLGSTAERVLRSVPCSVLAVKPTSAS